MTDIKITIDAGHGKNDNRSSTNPAYIEGTQMWYLAQYLEAELKEYGFTVYNTRQSIKDNPEVADRGKMAGISGSKLFLSLHSNTPGKSDDGTYNPKITGTICFYSVADKTTKALADTLGEKVSELMGHYFRGSQVRLNSHKTDYYGVLRNSAAYGCTRAIIIEHGFHTNISDSNYLLKDENLEKIAQAEAKIIAEYFGVKKPCDELHEFVVGEKAQIKEGAKYWNGIKVPTRYIGKVFYVTSAVEKEEEQRVVLGTSEDGKTKLNSALSNKYLDYVETEKEVITVTEPTVSGTSSIFSNIYTKLKNVIIKPNSTSSKEINSSAISAEETKAETDKKTLINVKINKKK